MRMSVSPEEIAQHLREEHGYQAALEQAKYNTARCIDEEAQSVWAKVIHALENLDFAQEAS